MHLLNQKIAISKTKIIFLTLLSLSNHVKPPFSDLRTKYMQPDHEEIQSKARFSGIEILLLAILFADPRTGITISKLQRTGNERKSNINIDNETFASRFLKQKLPSKFIKYIPIS